MSKYCIQWNNILVLFLFKIDFITDKVEETLGIDINKDGRIGGPGPTAEIERATHIDINRDGIIGGYRTPAGGGKINQCSWQIIDLEKTS